ncbi:hypothetical protein [Kurthia sibirica]|uniref:Uncharacterized protein n=1 Tax=Kurthia sibirica TaxID=202750 RepID=A0A2U3AQ09_9BACL|nr:hypothetical protein [Kurthia sibirica]PWI26545.1 hypothetical protein DEX24_01925 [Kurthia sibirica]GEK32794.1 hypothetical protein KSI01_03270 [Kurthia sibirica]
MYNSPVLFFESTTLVEILSPKTHFVRAAIICPESYKEYALELQRKFHDTAADIHYYSEPTQTREFIASQKMGVCFYVIGEWQPTATIFTIAVEEGVSEAELQVKIIGDKEKFVYCMKCFKDSQIPVDAKKVQCPCGAHLEVGPFYSIVRKGYIGYPFIPLTEGVI